MTLEKAIITAIEYEEKVRDVYMENAKKFKDPVAMKIFMVLADEEQSHVDYLESRLDEWKNTGKITLEKLDTIVPDSNTISAEVKKLRKRADQQDFGDEIEIFKKALALEVETSNYYKSVVGELPEEDRPLFDRFIEIEVGHELIVQAEIDNALGLGFWFDFMEFDLEAG
jgi:rubrerythrin